MSALQSNLRNALHKKDCFLYRNFSLPLILLMTLLHMDSPERELSSMHPRYSTKLYCLILISPLLMSNTSRFLSRFYVPKTIDLVLSSPKWKLNLFSTNQSQSELKFLFNFSSNFFKFLPSKNEA